MPSGPTNPNSHWAQPIAIYFSGVACFIIFVGPMDSRTGRVSSIPANFLNAAADFSQSHILELKRESDSEITDAERCLIHFKAFASFQDFAIH
jgi:hypothetical protein